MLDRSIISVLSDLNKMDISLPAYDQNGQYIMPSSDQIENMRKVAEKLNTFYQYAKNSTLLESPEFEWLLAKVLPKTSHSIHDKLEAMHQHFSNLSAQSYTHYSDLQIGIQSLQQGIKNQKSSPDESIDIERVDKIVKNFKEKNAYSGSVDLSSSLQKILSEDNFPKKSNFFSLQRPNYQKWAIDTAKKLLPLSQNITNQFNVDDIKNSKIPIINAANEMTNQISLGILNVNNKAELIRNIQCYFKLADECLKQGDLFSARAIYGALASLSVGHLYQKIISADKSDKFNTDLSLLAQKIKDNFSQAMVADDVHKITTPDMGPLLGSLTRGKEYSEASSLGKVKNFLKQCLENSKNSPRFHLEIPTDTGAAKTKVDDKSALLKNKFGISEIAEKKRERTSIFNISRKK